MKEVYYIGFYEDDFCPNRTNCHKNLAGSMKMKFIIQSLKKLGYKVNLVAIMFDDVAGAHKEEHVVIDNQEEHFYLPYFSIKIGGRNRGSVITVLPQIKKFIKKHVTSDSIVINYHALPFKIMFSELKKEIGYKWIIQVEEIYYYSRKGTRNTEELKMEEQMISGADGYLFVNDMLPPLYSFGKNYAVSYGNYHVFSENNIKDDPNTVNIAYTGVIAAERGIFDLLDAMPLLPNNYHLNILGFGTQENMNRFKDKIVQMNDYFRNERIHFYGTKSGSEYTEFLIHNQIGVGLIDLDSNIMFNAFPSKIMAYLGHSLNVVASRCKSIESSKIADMLYLCDNTPNDIARAICSIDVTNAVNNALRLKKLENEFINELRNILEN